MFYQRSLRRPFPQPKHILPYMSTTTPTDSVSSDEHKTGPVRARRRHRFILMSGGALFLIALVSGFVPQFRQRQIATVDTKELAIPTVAVVSPTVTTPKSGLNLPAEVKPWQEASTFARVNGYLKDWLVDIPFPGIITVRNVNVGDLITANNTSFEMFHIQQTDPLRVYFRIPQEDAANIAVGQTFNVQVGAQSAKTYPGTVISTSGAVSPDSRTMLVELQVENSKNEILPGSYATVRVPEVALGELVTLPDNTLIFRGKSVQVGVVDANGVVQLHDVKVGRDFGVQSEILSGVSESDKVIVNPSDSLVTGAVVRVSSPAPAAAKK